MIRKNIWGYNGPLLLTRVLQKWCGVNEIAAMNTTSCRGYNVLPPSSFYPIAYLKFKEYFIENSSLPNLGENVIGAHVWNKLSATIKVSKFSNQMYAQLAKSQCPLVFSTAHDFF